MPLSSKRLTLLSQATNDPSEPFRLLAESIPQLVWTTLPDGRIDFVNRRWIEYTGLDEDQSRGWSWKEAVHVDDRAECLAAWITAIDSGDDYEIEVRLRRHDGVYRWFLARAKPVLNAERVPVCWFGTCTDIHAQKSQWDETGQRYQQLVEQGEAQSGSVWRQGLNVRSRETHLEQLWADIERRMGVCPEFFKLAAPEPVIARGLFDLAQFAYLESPLPPLFKERLFTYLSRFCSVPYCLNRHAAFLLGEGHIAGDPSSPAISAEEVAGLIEEPYPEPDAIPGLLSELEQAAPLFQWPEPASSSDRLVRVACAVVFLQLANAERASRALRRVVGSQRYEQLMLLLAFVRMAHFWTAVHPDLTLEDDVERILAENTRLRESLRQRRADAERALLGKSLQSELSELRASEVAREVVRESQQQLQMALDAANLGIYSCDPRTGEVWWDQRIRGWWGMDPDEPVTYRTFFAGLHPADLRQTESAVERAMDPKGDGHYESEYRVINRKTGDTLWIAATGQVHFENGQPARLVGTLRDITARKMADEQLAFYKRALDAAAIVAVTDTSGIITDVNQQFCDVSGYSRDELIGQNHRIINSGLHPKEFFRNMYLTLRRGDMWRGDIRNRRRDGTFYWVDTTVIPEVRSDGQPLHYVAIR
ncbi:MAG: PAS domain S-box protein [Burkholderiaceae bacterium]